MELRSSVSTHTSSATCPERCSQAASSKETRPFPARKPLPIPLPHQTLQLPEGEGEEVDLDDAAKDTSQTPAHPGPWPQWQHVGGWVLGRQEEPWAPPVEEAGIDAVAGLQVLIDGVNQLNQPSKSLQSRLQGSRVHTVHTDLLACAHLPHSLPPSPQGHTLFERYLLARTLGVQEPVKPFPVSSLQGKPWRQYGEGRRRRAEGLGYSRSRARGWGIGSQEVLGGAGPGS